MDYKLFPNASSRVRHLFSVWHDRDLLTFCTVLLTRALMNARSGLRKSDSIVNYIVRNVVQIGLLGALCSLAELATWFLFPSTTVYEIFDITVGSIYTNVRCYSSRRVT